MTLALKLGDCGFQLWHRCRNVWELDHIGFRLLHQLAKFAQIIGMIGERGQDAARQRDVFGSNRDAGSTGKRLNNGQKRGTCQLRRFVYLGIQYVGSSGIAHDFQGSRK